MARVGRPRLPGLAGDFNPQLLRAIGRAAEAHRRDAEWIADVVEQTLETRVARAGGDVLELRREGWSELPDALAHESAEPEPEDEEGSD